jgi:hypothetical protein
MKISRSRCSSPQRPGIYDGFTERGASVRQPLYHDQIYEKGICESLPHGQNAVPFRARLPPGLHRGAALRGYTPRALSSSFAASAARLPSVSRI